jgi:hypothetical protein
MNKKISESIYSNGHILIPLAEVQHIEKLKYDGKPNGIWIITNFTKWNFEQDIWENPIYLTEEESQEFIKAWCYFRHEKDGIA